MKKILLLSPQPFFQWRGSPIRVRFNVLALVESGYEVDLLTLPIGEEVALPGANVIRVVNPFGVKNIPIGPSIHKIFFDILLLVKGLMLIRKNDYDLIHGIEEAGFIAVLLAKIKGCPAIFEKHSDPSSYKAGLVKNILLRLYAKVEQVTTGQAEAVIGTGAGLVEQVNAMGTQTKAFHIFDIPSSLEEPDPTAVVAVQHELQKGDEILATFVGSFAVYQGVDLLMAAIPLAVKAKVPVRFIIIGGTEEEITVRKTLLAEQGGADRVSFLGKVPPDSLPNYLAASDILLSPRVSGVNTPLKLLDYLKVGKAIVATDIKANRLILNPELAVLAKPEPQALAQGIVTLAQDVSARKEMGRKGYQLYLDKYNFKEYTKRLAACYRYVFEKGKGAA